MGVFSRFLSVQREYYLVKREDPSTLPHQPEPSRLEARVSLDSNSNGEPFSQHYTQITQALQSSLPSACRWLGSDVVELVGRHPIAAGGFADIWEGTYEGREVILKSYRCYMIFDVSRVLARFHNEIRICGLLHHKDMDVVPFVGVFSTETHPFCLVYERMSLDLRQHLGNEQNVGRLKLLRDIAQSLKHLHDRDIAHGGFKTKNILVDKDGAPHVAGLGNACVLAYPTALMVEGGASNQLSRNHSPELAGSRPSSDVTDPTTPTKASDIFDFAVMVYEVLTGRPPFSELTEIAAMYLMLKGDRPPRPNHPEISNRVWHMVEQCWHATSSQRMSIGEVVALLETELQHASDS